MRKKILLITTSLAAIAAVPASVNAALLASEDFDYADGLLAGNNGGTGWSTAWGDANGNTASTGGTISGNATTLNAGNIFRGLNFTFGDHDNIWISFDYQFVAGVFDGLQLFAGTTEEALIGNLGVPPTPNGQWTLAKDGSTGGIIASGVSSTTLKTGVIHYDMIANTGELWVGDGVGLVNILAPSVGTITGLGLSGVDTVRLGSAGNGSIIDSIRIGTTSLDVAAIPEPSTTAAFMGAAACLMAYVVRRRRK